jgi:hypothetical protein
MTAISITDLPVNRALEDKMKSAIRGGGAPWVYGWIRPFVAASSSNGAIINFYQINNYAQQMINQFQSIDVHNAAANASINVIADEHSHNLQSGQI